MKTNELQTLFNFVIETGEAVFVEKPIELDDGGTIDGGTINGKDRILITYDNERNLVKISRLNK